jgi:tRNA dimethylallyltransferase
MALAPKYLIVIAGPTASGKTSIAINLAQHFETEIISCDSRQLYREMSIGTAKPSSTELALVKHHFIDSHSIHDQYDAGQYEKDANDLLEQLFQTKDVVIMAGGTGLFIKAAIEGLDPLPAKSSELREKWNSVYKSDGIKPLQDRLKHLDIEKWETIDQDNPQRLIRAIEICESSGLLHSDLQTSPAKDRSFKCIQIALDVPRDLLYDRINQRVDTMIQQGLQQEVECLHQFSDLGTLKTVGYSEVIAALEGITSMSEAIDKIKQHTRNYAKRQITWFKKMNMSWFSPTDYDKILDFIKKEMQY